METLDRRSFLGKLSSLFLGIIFAPNIVAALSSDDEERLANKIMTSGVDAGILGYCGERYCPSVYCTNNKPEACKPLFCSQTYCSSRYSY